jgi:DNA-binding NtrC family response regulator
MPMARDTAPILVVEDDAQVMKVTVGMLNELGYRTIVADGAATALKLLDEHPDVALMFTDIVMPGMSGRQLADVALARRPDLRVLYTTGYTRTSVVTGGVIDQSDDLIMKPFSLEGLARTIDAVLQQPRPKRQGHAET